MNSHIKTAHDYGVKKALESCGYTSAEEVQKEATALGLFEQPKTAAAAPVASVDLASLKAKLG